jgi:hypothetical protein
VRREREGEEGAFDICPLRFTWRISVVVGGRRVEASQPPLSHV